MSLLDFYRSFAMWMGGQNLFVAYPKVGSVHVYKYSILETPFLEVRFNVLGEKGELTVQVKLEAHVDLKTGRAFVFKAVDGKSRNLLSIGGRTMLIETECCRVIKIWQRFSKSDGEVEKHLDLVLPRLLEEVKIGGSGEERLIETTVEVLGGIYLEGEKEGFYVEVDGFECIEVYPLEVGGMRMFCVSYSNPMGGAKGVMLEKDARKIEELIERLGDNMDEKVLRNFLRNWRRLARMLPYDAYSLN